MRLTVRSPADPVYASGPYLSDVTYETEVVTVNVGVVTGSETIVYTYQWMRDGEPIEGPPEFPEAPELGLA